MPRLTYSIPKSRKQAATIHGIEPRTISFKGAIQTLEAFQPLFAVQGDRSGHFGETYTSSSSTLSQLIESLTGLIALNRVYANAGRRNTIRC